jgi:NADPH:quinone reductase-like Zn-dependent oxidoreductase
MIGGDTLDRSFKMLKKGGTMISIKGQDGAGLAEKHDVHFETLWMTPDGAMLAELGALLSEGIVKPVIDDTFGMDEADAAYAQLAKGHAVGKVVIEVGN